MKKIDLEAHFSTEEYTQYLQTRKEPPRIQPYGEAMRQWLSPDSAVPRSVAFENKLVDLGSGRIAAMDAAGIDIQVLSLVLPGCEQFEAAEGTAVARKVNDELYEVIKKYPDRFAGLAALAPQDPEGATAELERAVKELGFKGANINSNARGEYLDNKKYWAIFEKAESLGVPLYFHPTIPSPAIIKPYVEYGMALCGPPMGFGVEAALHAMRLIHSGLFDKYPGLTIILGHLGEGLPFWLDRIDFFWLKPWSEAENRSRIAKKPSDYVKTNFMVTTSGMNFVPSLIATYLALGADRIIFAADYPFEDSRETVQAVEAMPICDADKEKIFHLNAESLFGLKK